MIPVGSPEDLPRLRALAESGAPFATRTVIAEGNYRVLGALVEEVARLRPRTVELWAAPLPAPVEEIGPQLLAALRACVEHGIAPVVRWFPRCLLGDLARYQDNAPPGEHPVECACLYEGVCQDAPSPCSGLPVESVRRYGWAQDALRPRRRAEVAVAGHGEGAGFTMLGGEPAAVHPGTAEWLARVGVAPGESCAGWKLRSARPAMDGSLGILTFERGAHAVDVHVRPTDPAARCFARTRQFDVSYAPVPADARDAALALVQAFVAQLTARENA